MGRRFAPQTCQRTSLDDHAELHPRPRGPRPLVHPHVGAKAASLGELIGAGFPIPPGFVVTTAAYAAYLKSSDPGPVRSLVESLVRDDAFVDAEIESTRQESAYAAARAEAEARLTARELRRLQSAVGRVRAGILIREESAFLVDRGAADDRAEAGRGPGRPIGPRTGRRRVPAIPGRTGPCGRSEQPRHHHRSPADGVRAAGDRLPRRCALAGGDRCRAITRRRRAGLT